MNYLISAGDSDRDLEQRVLGFLRQWQIPSLRRIIVKVCEGTVTLHGRVPSFYQRQLCLACCQRVAGVLKLIDEIEVVTEEGAGLAV